MRRQLPKVYGVWQCLKHVQELCKVRSEAVFEVQTRKYATGISSIFCQHLRLQGMQALDFAAPGHTQMVHEPGHGLMKPVRTCIL